MSRLSCKTSSRKAAAFTLAELLVVLAIMSILTVVAVQSLVPVASQARFEATQRTIAEIQAAVEGPANSSAAAVQGNTACFLADAGRLPVNLNELLLYGGQSVTTFAYINATNPLGSAAVTATVPGGWRGPYMRLGIGSTTVVDGWGRPFVAVPDTTNTYVAGIMSLGADGKADGDGGTIDGYNADFGVSFVNAAQPTTINGMIYQLDASTSPPTRVRPTKRDGSGQAVQITGTPSTGLALVAYGPLLAVDPGSAASVQSWTATMAADTDTSNIPTTAATYSLVLAAPALGPRVLQAFIDGTPVGSPVYVTVRPGQSMVIDVGVPTPATATPPPTP